MNSTIQQVVDCVSLPLADDSVDLVVTSPPYEDARTYGIDYNLKKHEWVDWAIPRFQECLRVCRGLVVWVVQGRTKQFQWSATPAHLMSRLDKAGAVLRNPPIYYRSGIPGSGGPDWLRSDYEWCICATKNKGRLPWSDNKACGHPPKYQPGGDPTHRTKKGERVRYAQDQKEVSSFFRDGMHRGKQNKYHVPKIVNPGNVIKCSGGHCGHPLAHENEAPFPLALAEFFVKSFCPPDGVVLDPMCGSGTTGHAAKIHGRNYVLYDIRPGQVALALQRMAEV